MLSYGQLYEKGAGVSEVQCCICKLTVNPYKALEFIYSEDKTYNEKVSLIVCFNCYRDIFHKK